MQDRLQEREDEEVEARPDREKFIHFDIKNDHFVVPELLSNDVKASVQPLVRALINYDVVLLQRALGFDFDFSTGVVSNSTH